jgi:predicted ATP-binding protein involved in virulence
VKLSSLRLVNFRGFEDTTLDLDPALTVLVGINGSGKTTLLEALDIAVSHLESAMLPGHEAKDIRGRDVKLGQDSCSIELNAPGFRLSVSRNPVGKTERTPAVLPPAVLPPLLVPFWIDRTILRTPPPPEPGFQARISVRTRFPAWDDRINGGYTGFERFESWFREQEDFENQERVRKQDLEHSDSGLDAVRRVLGRLLLGFEDPHIDRARPTNSQFVVKKHGHELSAAQLSDGERSLLVMGGLIARTLALLDGTASEDPLEREALVLIDEMELHLHPAWQREVIPALTRALPNCQFVVTTHSPQVLSSVPKQSVVILDDFHVASPPTPTKGRDSTSILADVMLVTEHPREISEKLGAIGRALDDEDLGAAKAAIDELASELGELDREVVRLRSLLVFLEGSA